MKNLFYEGKNISVEVLPNGVKRMLLSRPDIRNAFNAEMIEEISYAISKLSGITDVHEMRLLIIEGEGKVFCAGADLAYMRSQSQKNEEQNLSDARELGRMFFKLASFPAPVVSVIKGAAIGGGLGLAVCSDYVIATEDAVFATSEVLLGLLPAVIGPYILRKIGVGFASSFMLTGKRMTAHQALHMGIVHKVTNADELTLCLQESIQTFLLTGPHAVRRTKDIIKNLSPLPTLAQFEFTATQIAAARCSEEGQAGLSAFFNKNKPYWCHDL